MDLKLSTVCLNKTGAPLTPRKEVKCWRKGDSTLPCILHCLSKVNFGHDEEHELSRREGMEEGKGNSSAVRISMSKVETLKGLPERAQCNGGDSQ